jgi:DNA-binding response OmpR family regulator
MKSIIIIEDDINVNKLLVFRLQNKGYEVKSFLNGEDALKFINEYEGIDLVLIDLMLPLMSGTEVILEIKKIDENIPIIVLTAKTLEKNVVEHFKLGINDYIKKPFNFNELLARIERIINE